MLAVLGRSWGPCWRSWAALGPYVGGPGPLLGPLWAVLGRYWGVCERSWRVWGLCGRSWAAPGAFVSGPGGPGAEKWPKPEREQGPKGVGSSSTGPDGPDGPEGPDLPEGPVPIFSIDMLAYRFKAIT